MRGGVLCQQRGGWRERGGRTVEHMLRREGSKAGSAARRGRQRGRLCATHAGPVARLNRRGVLLLLRLGRWLEEELRG